MSQKRDASGRKASCYVADAFLTRLKLIWPISSPKISKMPKTCVLGKKLQDFKSFKYPFRNYRNSFNISK